MPSQLSLKNYYIVSVVMIILAFLFFCRAYEKRKPQAREIVTIAVLSTIAIASRAVFAMLPFFKPMVGIIMISGMALGAEAGFLIGAVTGFISNFIFGQGPWTPWQMFAYGMAGALAGFLGKKGIMKPEKKIRTSIVGYFLVQLVVGPILDTSSIFVMGNSVRAGYILAVYGAGIIPNAFLGGATFLTLFLGAGSMVEKLQRIRKKYGMEERQ